MTARPISLFDYFLTDVRTRIPGGHLACHVSSKAPSTSTSATPTGLAGATSPTRLPTGAPNVLVVLYDDTGQAAWSPYGGRIDMPTMDRLAANGLTYTQWHTTALCSPTRSCFLTGRNHHQNAFASISEASTGFPGYNSHIPRENASMATVLRNAG